MRSYKDGVFENFYSEDDIDYTVDDIIKNIDTFEIPDDEDVFDDL